MIAPASALAAAWRELGGSSEALDLVDLTGREPVLPSSFAVGTAAQASLAATGLAAAELWRRRTGQRQRVAVDMRDAAIEFRSERYLRVDGKPAPELWDKIAGTYRCGDGRWVRLHTNFPHHRDGALALLGCDYDRSAVQRALDSRNAEEIESAAAERGLVIAAVRSFAEWDAHPQGRSVACLPLLAVEKIGEAPVRDLPAASRPLAGIRVLDLTRVIAGPVCGRVLAAHGAEVLMLTGPHLPSIPPLVIDTGRGKLSAHLDLRHEEGRARLRELVRQADVFVQGYRPGALAGLGFGPEDVARLRPGIVYVSLSAYGEAGPWAGRRGFDTLVQTASGFNLAEADAAGSDEPRLLPAAVLDHATGCLMAAAAMMAVVRQTEVGGSWQVRASLAQTGRWLRGMGRVHGGAEYPDPRQGDVVDRLEEVRSGFGWLISVRHAVRLEATPPGWDRPSVPLGTHAATWPA